MSRRETFLESARSANDQALTAAPTASRTGSSDLAPILAALAETNRRLEALERAIRALPAVSRESPPSGTRGRLARVAAWALGAALLTLAAITLVRPDWALGSRQRAELMLGERLYLRLQAMEEPERLEVLKSLWVEAPPTSD
jgi:hypothetical protein